MLPPKVKLSPYERAVNHLNQLSPALDRIFAAALDDLRRQRDEESARCRAAAQALIEDVGADGPMSLEQVVERTRARLAELEARCEQAAMRLEMVVGSEGEGSNPPSLEQMITRTLALLRDRETDQDASTRIKELEAKVAQRDKQLARYREVVQALDSELAHVDHEFKGVGE